MHSAFETYLRMQAPAVTLEEHRAGRFRAAARQIGAAVIIAGLGVLVGWSFDVSLLKNISPRWASMKPNAALSFVLLGASLVFQRRFAARFWIEPLLVGVVILVGLLTLAQHAFNIDLRIDQLLFKDQPGAVATSSPGRMGPNTAFAFVLSGLSLLLPRLLPRRAAPVAPGCALGVIAIGLLALLGYLHSVSALYGVAAYTQLSLPSAVLFVFIGIAALLALPDVGLMRVVNSESAAGVAARRLAPAVLGIPLVLGLLGELGQRQGLFGAEFGFSLNGVLSVVAYGAVFAWVVRDLKRSEALRHLAEEGLRKAHADLELRVEQRTSELKASELRFRSVTESAHDAIISIDSHGAVTSCNPAVEAIFGYSPEQLIGGPLDLVIPQRHRGGHQEGLKRMSKGGASTLIGKAVELQALHQDGRELPIELSLSTWKLSEEVFFTGIVRDITERKRFEASLLEREENLAVTLNSIGDGVIATDAEDRIVRMNPVAERLTGWPFSLGRGRRLTEVLVLVKEDTREPVTSPTEQALREGRVILLASQTALVSRNGSEVPVADSAAPIRDSTGKVTGAILVFRDITDERQAQLAMKKARAQAEESARLASVGILAAGVAHEINNPLAYVIANVGFIEAEIRQVEAELAPGRLTEMKDIVAEAQEGAERIRRIVRDMKAFSRADTESVGPVDLRRVLEWAVNVAFSQIRHSARLVKDYAAVPLVRGNETRLGQVFINLLVNAAQAIPQGNFEKNEVRIITRLDSQGRIAVDIRDTGTGIPLEVRARIFDPFFTTKPVGVGTGLGLSVCHGIISSLGGEISVESEVGKGTTFTVCLQPADLCSNAPDPIAPSVDTAKRGRVLVVDHEPNLLMAVKRALSPEYEVVTALRAEEALEKCRGGDRFDVILCALLMPGMTGIGLYEAAKQLHPGLEKKLVFLTGDVVLPSSRDFLALVANQRIEETFDVANLRAVIRSAIAGGSPLASLVQ